MADDNSSISGTIASAARPDVLSAPAVDSATAERLDKLENIIEQVGKTSEYIQSLNDYLVEKKNEIIILRWLRYIIIGFAMVFAAFSVAMLVCLVFFHKLWFYMIGPYDRGIIFVSCMAGCVVILSLLLKGAFRSIHEAEQSDLIPPSIKMAFDAVKDNLPKM